MATNAIGKDRKFWSVVPVADASIIAMVASQAEEQGIEGLFAPQVYGPPFIPLAAAATATSSIKLATGIAIAAARSPTETAMAALDMDRVSGGRFILGLGSSVSAWTSGIFGSPPIKPVSHLRETVEAVRYIVANAHEKLEPFKGEFFTAAGKNRDSDLDCSTSRKDDPAGRGDWRRRYWTPHVECRVDPGADGTGH